MMNAQEYGKGQSLVGIIAASGIKEYLTEKAEWKITRYASADDAKNQKIYNDTEAKSMFGSPQQSQVTGNVLLNEGINELWTLMCSGSGTKFNSTAAYLGVGSSTQTASSTQIALKAGSTLQKYVAMSAAYPTYGTAQKATWRSEFGSTQANYAWNEFTVANGNSTAAKNLNRKVSAQGTKASGQVWQLTLDITLS